MAKYTAIYVEKNHADFSLNYKPDFVREENGQVCIRSTKEEMAEEIKQDFQYWKNSRPNPAEVKFEPIDDGFMATDDYATLKYYIKSLD